MTIRKQCLLDTARKMCILTQSFIDSKHKACWSPSQIKSQHGEESWALALPPTEELLEIVGSMKRTSLFSLTVKLLLSQQFTSGSSHNQKYLCSTIGFNGEMKDTQLVGKGTGRISGKIIKTPMKFLNNKIFFKK